MHQLEIDEIRQTHLGRRTLFYYYKDRYALQLLTYFVGSGKTVREVKQSRFGGLLQKPLLKQVIEHLPDGFLTPDHLQDIWSPEPQVYRLALSKWGEPDTKSWKPYYQTSRAGLNLVLQLNFSNVHNRPYQRLIKPRTWHPFEYKNHPIARTGDHTLAWSRLDVDLAAGEALIEEIQNDWIRYASGLQQRVLRTYARSGDYLLRVYPRNALNPAGTMQDLFRYMDEVLRPHIALWDEAMLSATLWFLRNELGIQRVFYHSFRSGNVLKDLTRDPPPRSL